MDKEIEIEAFRAGTPASAGITSAQLLDAAANYDPARNPAPVVMGHPRDDQSAPAFGAVSGARVDGDKLLLRIKNLAAEAVDGIRQSRILNRSVAFWHPDHPSNPTPGKLSLRHLGLLGGAMPAIPNMAPLRFSADDPETLLADGEAGAPVIFAAPGQLDQAAINQIAAAVADILKPKGKEFSVTDEELKAAQDAVEAREKALAERESALATKETEFAAQERERAKADKEAREKANTEFAARIVADGKFPAGHQADLVTVLNAMPVEALQFSDDKSESPADALKRILSNAVPVMQFGAISPQGNPSKTGDDDAEAEALRKANARAADAWKA